MPCAPWNSSLPKCKHMLCFWWFFLLHILTSVCSFCFFLCRFFFFRLHKHRFGTRDIAKQYIFRSLDLLKANVNIAQSDHLLFQLLLLSQMFLLLFLITPLIYFWHTSSQDLAVYTLRQLSLDKMCFQRWLKHKRSLNQTHYVNGESDDCKIYFTEMYN